RARDPARFRFVEHRHNSFLDALYAALTKDRPRFDIGGPGSTGARPIGHGMPNLGGFRMRKLLVSLLTVLVLATAGAAADMARSAAAASQTVTISATGYKPTAVSIFVGDTVVFKNSDTVVHTADFKQTTGLHCSAAL